MSIKQLHRLLTTPARGMTDRAVLVCFGLSLLYAGLYQIPVVQQAFGSNQVVQDDARLHVFWMWRFLEPSLFPNDLIANYFQSVAPAAYTELYRSLATLGMDPLLASKLFPPILAVLTTAYCFALSLQLIPLPGMALVATMLFNQNFWMRDDLASASPRAFLNLVFLAFLYSLLRRSWLPCLLAIGLLGGFYPQYVLVAAGVLFVRLWRWQGGRLRLTDDRQERRLCLAGLGVALAVMVPYALSSSEFGPTIAAAEARQLPEFLPNGRARFFYSDFGRYWLSGGRSGIQPPLDPPLLALGLLLPILLGFAPRFPLLQQCRNLGLLTQVTIAGLGWFFLAHALLFRLHLPSRYTQHSLRIVMALAATIVLAALLDALVRWGVGRSSWQSWVAPVLALGTVLTLLLYPLSLGNFPKTTYLEGRATSLYTYLAQQPETTLVASLSEEVNNLPTFARRSILTGSEYAVPYHLGYYRQFRQRVLELIQAQYSPDIATVRQLIQKYRITHWLLDRGAFEVEFVAQNGWLRQYQPTTAQAIANLRQGNTPALQGRIDRCKVLETEGLILLQASCLLADTPN